MLAAVFWVIHNKNNYVSCQKSLMATVCVNCSNHCGRSEDMALAVIMPGWHRQDVWQQGERVLWASDGCSAGREVWLIIVWKSFFDGLFHWPIVFTSCHAGCGDSGVLWRCSDAVLWFKLPLCGHWILLDYVCVFVCVCVCVCVCILWACLCGLWGHKFV